MPIIDITEHLKKKSSLFFNVIHFLEEKCAPDYFTGIQHLQSISVNLHAHHKDNLPDFKMDALLTGSTVLRVVEAYLAQADNIQRNLVILKKVLTNDLDFLHYVTFSDKNRVLDHEADFFIKTHYACFCTQLPEDSHYRGYVNTLRNRGYHQKILPNIDIALATKSDPPLFTTQLFYNTNTNCLLGYPDALEHIQSRTLEINPTQAGLVQTGDLSFIKDEYGTNDSFDFQRLAFHVRHTMACVKQGYTLSENTKTFFSLISEHCPDQLLHAFHHITQTRGKKNDRIIEDFLLPCLNNKRTFLDCIISSPKPIMPPQDDHNADRHLHDIKQLWKKTFQGKIQADLQWLYFRDALQKFHSPDTQRGPNQQTCTASNQQIDETSSDSEPALSSPSSTETAMSTTSDDASSTATLDSDLEAMSCDSENSIPAEYPLQTECFPELQTTKNHSPSRSAPSSTVTPLWGSGKKGTDLFKNHDPSYDAKPNIWGTTDSASSMARYHTQGQQKQQTRREERRNAERKALREGHVCNVRGLVTQPSNSKYKAKAASAEKRQNLGTKRKKSTMQKQKRGK